MTKKGSMRAQNGFVFPARSWRILSFVTATLLVARKAAYVQECSWRKLGYGGGGRYTAIAVGPATSSQVFVSSDVAGCHKSADSERTFKNLGQGLTGLAVADGVVWMGTAGYNHKAGDGLFVSFDGGASFTRCESDIPRAGVNALTPEAGAKTPTALIGFNGLGVYEVRSPKTGR